MAPRSVIRMPRTDGASAIASWMLLDAAFLSALVTGKPIPVTIPFHIWT